MNINRHINKIDNIVYNEIKERDKLIINDNLDMKIKINENIIIRKELRTLQRNDIDRLNRQIYDEKMQLKNRQNYLQ